jgi:exonuclease SbcC
VRPLVVDMQAFGPFPDRQVLDFADLRGLGFFLITGPTGAGKTTILDAMTFALYGEASGGVEKDGARTGAAMRSDHAHPETLTRIRFDFSLGPTAYRVERIPEQERPKIHGDGTTTQKQDATLWRLRRDDDGALCTDVTLATGWSKVTAQSEDLLGFRAEQFRQVVMLPQGRFQQFLEANSGQREQLLRALFDTGRFADIERALHDEALKLKREAETTATQRDEVLRQAGTDDTEALRERCARLCVDHGDACTLADQAARDNQAAQQTLAAGVGTADKLKDRDAAVARVAELKARDAEVQARRAELEAARRAADAADVARQATEAARELVEAQADAEKTQTETAAARTALEAARAALAVEESRSGARDDAAKSVQRLRALESPVQALASARGERKTAAADLDDRRKKRDRADERWEAAKKHVRHLEGAWVDAQAGLLAANLTAGRPCPVCGSTEHPTPAELSEVAPSQDELEAARSAVDTALAQRDAARQALAAAEAACAAADAQEAKWASLVPADLAEPDKLRDALEKALRAESNLKKAFDDAKTAAHDREVVVSSAAARQEAASTTLTTVAARARKARQLLAERLDTCGFATEDDLAAASRTPQQTTDLESLVAAHDTATVQAAERLRIASAAAEGLEPPDLDALAQTASRAAESAGTARDGAATLKAQFDTAETLLARLCELEELAAGVAERYQSLGRLADVAAGRNGRRISHQSYVLGAFLDDVLVAASARLRLMSKQRFSLDRTEERTGRTQSAGLDLVAYDAWTGVARPVATLSGGEKFMAALSLALGLADVVQAFAGGIRLETVFVDEGFGSLDDESLDLAISALEGLHAGGRLVGIISHVGELRERIDARLEVSVDKTGSAARFVVP